jgi:hypothetical protein
MNYCPKCRKKLVVQDFCVECGADLSAYQQQENSGIDSFDFSSLGGAAQQLQQQLRDADFEITNGVLTRYRGKGSNVVIPKGVVEIGTQAFSGNNHITSISFPEGVRTIGFHAFSWCKNLTEAVLPSSVRTINDCAFMGCSSLRQLTLPASLTTIGKEAFYDCEQLEKIRFEAAGLRPLSESSYPHRIFQNAGSKSCGITVTVAANVHSIPDYLFNSTGCSLTAVVFEPGSICTSIGAFAFCTRDTLRSVQLPLIEKLRGAGGVLAALPPQRGAVHPAAAASARPEPMKFLLFVSICHLLSLNSVAFQRLIFLACCVNRFSSSSWASPWWKYGYTPI